MSQLNLDFKSTPAFGLTQLSNLVYVTVENVLYRRKNA